MSYLVCDKRKQLADEARLLVLDESWRIADLCNREVILQTPVIVKNAMMMMKVHTSDI